MYVCMYVYTSEYSCTCVYDDVSTAMPTRPLLWGYDDVTCVYDDVTCVYDDVTYVYDDVTYVSSGGVARHGLHGHFCGGMMM